MRQLSIWSSATESRTSLRSSSFCFREWTSWSLVRRRRSAKALNASQGSAEPGPDDPLFFDPSVVVPQFLSDESTDEIWKSLLQAAGDSGIDPAIVYAMNKTGRIVTETNAHS